jgi:hypothetical protein
MQCNKLLEIPKINIFNIILNKIQIIFDVEAYI